jgi:superfamily II DNA or RNA helicase
MQKMRLSTALTPRIISCFEDHLEHVAIPRGCLEELGSLLAEYKIDFHLDDKRTDGVNIDIDFQGRLTKLQEDVAREILGHDIGVVVAPPGTGKTILGTYLIATRARNTLVLVHRKPLLDQWVADYIYAMRAGQVQSRSKGQRSGPVNPASVLPGYRP